MTSATCYRMGLAAFTTLAVCALLGSLPASAGAQQCEQDDDCPDKFSCEVTGAIECPSAKPCEAGEKCETPADCEPQDVRQCVSPSCENDDDCPSDMVCYEQTTNECGGSTPSCDPNGECPEPVDAGPPECTEKTVSSCVARYVPPCSEDADCGDGFSCEEETISSCSGGGSVGSGTGTGGAASSSMDGGQASPPDAETHCTTMPTGKFHCVLQPLPCEDESDCPAGFSCEDDPNQATCADTEPAAQGGADDGNAGSASSRCPDASSSKVCLPPYYDLMGGVGRGEQAGSSDAGGKGTTENPPTTPSTKRSSGGCSATPGGSDASTPIALLALLSFMLGVRSTRRLELRRARRRA